MFEMLIVERERKQRLFTSIVQDCTEIVKLDSPQIEGNKDCEVLRCMDSYQF